MTIQDSDESVDSPDNELIVTDGPIMQTAIDVLTKLSITNKMILKASGAIIPNAVAIANIITENMLKGNSKIDEILLDSEISQDHGMISNIKIVLLKNKYTLPGPFRSIFSHSLHTASSISDSRL